MARQLTGDALAFSLFSDVVLYMMDLNLPVGFYSRWAPDANTPSFSAGLVPSMAEL